MACDWVLCGVESLSEIESFMSDSFPCPTLPLSLWHHMHKAVRKGKVAGRWWNPLLNRLERLERTWRRGFHLQHMPSHRIFSTIWLSGGEILEGKEEYNGYMKVLLILLLWKTGQHQGVGQGLHEEWRLTSQSLSSSFNRLEMSSRMWGGYQL